MKKIVIIDDDLHISNMLKELLSKEGYQVSQAYSGTEAVMLLSSYTPDLILLDLMLPGLSGEEVLPLIKGIPVIIVSAKVDIDNKVDLLLKGACDYIVKPFHSKELLARIAVQLRNPQYSRNENSLFYASDVELNMDLQIVKIADQQISLTKTEASILRLLVQNPTQVITKSQLIERINQETYDCTESSLKVHVSNLRKKLRVISDKDYIESVWGIGFKMRQEKS